MNDDSGTNIAVATIGMTTPTVTACRVEVYVYYYTKAGGGEKRPSPSHASPKHRYLHAIRFLILPAGTSGRGPTNDYIGSRQSACCNIHLVDIPSSKDCLLQNTVLCSLSCIVIVRRRTNPFSDWWSSVSATTVGLNGPPPGTSASRRLPATAQEPAFLLSRYSSIGIPFCAHSTFLKQQPLHRPLQHLETRNALTTTIRHRSVGRELRQRISACFSDPYSTFGSVHRALVHPSWTESSVDQQTRSDLPPIPAHPIMSTPGSPLPHPAPYTPAHLRSRSPAGSTAYQGYQGLLHDDNIDLDRDGYDLPHAIATPSTTATSASKFGAKLLSNWTASQPVAAAALTRSGSILHARAKSLASYVPKLNGSPIAQNTSSTPERQSAAANPLFGNIFNGDSAPIRLGVALPTSPTVKEEPDFVMDYKPTFTERPHARRLDTTQSTTSTNKVAGWFNRRSALPATPPTTAANVPDEILAMNIHASLFPHGPADPLSPHAFNDLLVNATNLLQKLQVAYREKVDYIASVRPEIDVQREEVEEADTRSKHLKMQLEDLARRHQEQARTMQEMAQQLAQAKLNAQEKTPRTVRLVRQTEDFEDNGGPDATPSRRKRGSEGGSSCSDSGFESEIDYADSIMSSGLDTPSVVLNGGESWQATPKPHQHARPSPHALGGNLWQDASDQDLRSENRMLRNRLEMMGAELQECIDFRATLVLGGDERLWPVGREISFSTEPGMSGIGKGFSLRRPSRAVVVMLCWRERVIHADAGQYHCREQRRVY
nr:hypothetical protein CFP56_60738 [Quercus suber]